MVVARNSPWWPLGLALATGCSSSVPAMTDATVTADAADVHGTDLAPSPDAAPDAGSTDGALMDGGTADAGPSVGDVPMDGTDVGMDGPIADVGTDGASMEGSAPDAVPPDGACVPACVSERSCTDGRCQ